MISSSSLALVRLLSTSKGPPELIGPLRQTFDLFHQLIDRHRSLLRWPPSQPAGRPALQVPTSVRNGACAAIADEGRVHNDSSVDHLFGDENQDWVQADLIQDLLADLSPEETVTSL
jgi:hypothetical protein